MSIRDDNLHHNQQQQQQQLLTPPPPVKKLRFRGDLNLHYFDQRIEEVWDDGDRKKNEDFHQQSQQNQQHKGKNNLRIWIFRNLNEK